MSKIPEPGEQIGERYRIVRVIGEGGMGTVLEAENQVTHKRVALKLLHPSVANRRESAQRLIREARAMSRIRHANVVDVYDVVDIGEGQIFLVLELLEGEPLADIVDRGGMPVPAFISLMIQAMRGVAAAHDVGVIHRDVHPGNVFIERSGTHDAPVAKVLDFGISKLDNETPGHPLTQSGTTMGTPHYMSYEQLCASRDLDARADIYSFGVILYRALTGQFPYSAESLTELAVQLVTTKPVSVKALQRAVPSALDRLVMACIAREREQRPSSLVELIAELEPFGSEDSFSALQSGASRQIPLVIGRRPRTPSDGAVRVLPTSVSISMPALTAVPRPSVVVSAPVEAAQSVVPAAPPRVSESAAAPTTATLLAQLSPSARRVLWPASLALLVLALGAGVLGLMGREPSVGASAPVLPTVKRDVTPEPAPLPVPRAPAASEHRPAALPSGVATPTSSAPAAPAPSAAPAAATKPPRVWVPRRPTAPAGNAAPASTTAPAVARPSASDPYYRAGRPPEAGEFK